MCICSSVAVHPCLVLVGWYNEKDSKTKCDLEEVMNQNETRNAPKVPLIFKLSHNVPIPVTVHPGREYSLTL